MKLLVSELKMASEVMLCSDDLTRLMSGNSLCAKEIIGELHKQHISGTLTSYAHQLGFYKFQLAGAAGTYPRSIRLHYWRREQVENDIHDHISSFASRILHGSLRNEFYELNEKGCDYSLQKFESAGGCCKPKASFDGKIGALKFVNSEFLEAGEIYYLKHDRLHRLIPVSDELITVIVQDKPVIKDINVYRKETNKSARCESAAQIPDAELVRVLGRIEQLLGQSV